MMNRTGAQNKAPGRLSRRLTAPFPAPDTHANSAGRRGAIASAVSPT